MVDQFDEEDQEKAEAAEKQKRVARVLQMERWRQVMAMPQAQEIFWELISELNVLGLSFNHSGSVMNFNEGRRSVGIVILDRWTESSPDTFFKIMKSKKGETNA